jgi:hypothetical protein
MGLLERFRPSRTAAVGRAQAGMAGLTDKAPQPNWSKRLETVLPASGFADWYCGELGSRVARYRGVVQELKPGTDDWVPVEDQAIAGPVREIWDSYRGGEEAETRESLVRRHAELYQIHGQVMMCVNDDLTYEVFHRGIGEPKLQGGVIVEWRFNPVPDAAKNAQLVYQPNRVFRRWVPDRTYPRLPWSPMKPAVDDLERYVGIVRMIRSGVESAAIMRRIIAMNGSWIGVDLSPEEAATAGTTKAGVRDFMTIARAARDNQGLAPVAPYFVWSEDTEADVRAGIGKVEWPSPFDEVIIEAKRDALRDTVRSMNAPINYLDDGPGAGNHWSDWLIEDQVDEVGAQPLADRVFQDITEVVVRPMLTALQAMQRFPASADPSRLRLWYDPTPLQAEPKDTAMIFDALHDGLISEDYARQRLHIPIDAVPDPTEVARRKPAIPSITDNLTTTETRQPPELAAVAGLGPYRGELPRWKD